MKLIVRRINLIDALSAPAGSPNLKGFLHWTALILIAAFSVSFASAQEPATVPGPGLSAIRHANRVVLGENVAHYTYDVRTGPGTFDRIRLYRVVKELQPFQSARTFNGIFMIAGSPNYFAAMFIPSTISQAAAWDHGLAVYLAKNGIDVWGMDYGWALVPAETTDVSFFKNWGMLRDSRDSEIGLSLARLIRGASGQGFGPLEMAGFSYGGQIAYAIAGEETQKPRILRNVKGLVVLVVGMQPHEQVDRDSACSSVPAYHGASRHRPI
jgi:hypothetical protein